jgi:hypothetical protein
MFSTVMEVNHKQAASALLSLERTNIMASPILPITGVSPIGESSAINSPTVASPAAAPVAGGSPTYVPAAQTSQIQLLFQQGVSPAEIAAMLGLSLSAVDGYLGVGNTASAAAASPTQTQTTTGSAYPTISTVG